MSCSQYVTFSFLLVVVSLLILIPFSYFMLAILIKQPKGGEYCFLNAYLILYSYFLQLFEESQLLKIHLS